MRGNLEGDLNSEVPSCVSICSHHLLNPPDKPVRKLKVREVKQPPRALRRSRESRFASRPSLSPQSLCHSPLAPRLPVGGCRRSSLRSHTQTPRGVWTDVSNFREQTFFISSYLNQVIWVLSTEVSGELNDWGGVPATGRPGAELCAMNGASVCWPAAGNG